MEKTTFKTIPLTYEQLNMVYTMIRSAEVRKTRTGAEHKELLNKIRAAKTRSVPGLYNLINLEPAECKLIRTYNTEYCNILADQDDEGELESAEILEIYQLATSIQLAFTSQY